MEQRESEEVEYKAIYCAACDTYRLGAWGTVKIKTHISVINDRMGFWSLRIPGDDVGPEDSSYLLCEQCEGPATLVAIQGSENCPHWWKIDRVNSARRCLICHTLQQGTLIFEGESDV